MIPQSGLADVEVNPNFVNTIPSGYSNWELISVAHEEGNLNSLVAVLGNVQFTVKDSTRYAPTGG